MILVVLLLGWLGMWLVLLFRELAEQRGKLAKPGVENFPGVVPRGRRVAPGRDYPSSCSGAGFRRGGIGDAA